MKKFGPEGQIGTYHILGKKRTRPGRRNTFVGTSNRLVDTTSTSEETTNVADDGAVVEPIDEKNTYHFSNPSVGKNPE